MWLVYEWIEDQLIYLGLIKAHSEAAYDWAELKWPGCNLKLVSV